MSFILFQEVPSSVPPTQLAAVPPSIAISGQYLAQPALQASIS